MGDLKLPAIDYGAMMPMLILFGAACVGVLLEAEHLCMSLRGVRAAGARTVTSALHGLLRTDAGSRQEFLAFTGISR